MKLYHTIWNELTALKPTDKLFLIYLLCKQNQYGDKPFYLSDRVIMGEMGITQRKSLYRMKKRVNKTPFVEYRPGKYRKSVSIWHIKGVNNDLSPASKRPQQEDGIKKMDIRRASPIIINNNISVRREDTGKKFMESIKDQKRHSFVPSNNKDFLDIL